MSGFDPAWLDLRSGADEAARDGDLLTKAVAFASALPSPLIVDLGAGTGASTRVLAPHLPSARWRLVDGDKELLRIAAQRCPDAEIVPLDLASSPLPIRDARLVTASALLDLVSAQWIERLVRDVVSGGAAFYGVLSFDGLMSWSPEHPLDEDVRRAFNRHQRSDKGFGLSLGGDAVVYARECFANAGYAIEMTESPWRLGPRDMMLKRQLIKGIASAAEEAGQAGTAEWSVFRLDHLATGSCRIGHQDLFASPAS
ncbi:class I SAM-dependent methyltransferase [Flaviflagellibacter deserti]|uniref:Class I SAM-dependent methyltransferase n=1 Tax=Flaviflagellibacter deserti TaxID=2267266 RepID=A0ABV9YZI7_9HYPH